MRSMMVKGVLIVLFLVAGALTGCSRGEQPVEAQTPLTLRFGVPFRSSDTDPFLVEALERYQQEHSHVSVEIVPLYASEFLFDADAMETLRLDAFLEGSDPTLIAGEQAAVLSLEWLIGDTAGFEEGDFWPNVLNAFRWQGRLYAIPADVNVAVMYYNRDLFDAQGVAYPQADWTWQDFLSTAQQMTTIAGEGEGQTGHWGFVSHPMAFDVYPFILQHGAKMVDDPLRPTRLVLNDPLVAEAIQWYADLGLVHKVMPIVRRDAVDDHSLLPVDKFSLQEAAMTIGGVAARGGTIIPWDFRWGAVPLPSGQVRGTWLGTGGYYIAARTAHPQEAWDLVRSLSESSMTRFVPARRAEAESATFRQQVGVELADAVLATLDGDAVTWFWDDRFSDWAGSVTNQSYWVVKGDKTAEEMMNKLQTDFADWSVERP